MRDRVRLIYESRLREPDRCFGGADGGEAETVSDIYESGVSSKLGTRGGLTRFAYCLRQKFFGRVAACASRESRARCRGSGCRNMSKGPLDDFLVFRVDDGRHGLGGLGVGTSVLFS